MSTIETLKDFLSDDQILEVAEASARQRTLEAARRLQYFLIDKWNISTAQIRGLRRDLKNVSPSLYTEKARYNEHFARINADAVNKHGFSYITASEAAIRVVERFGLNIERPEIKALTASIVSAILDISKSST